MAWFQSRQQKLAVEMWEYVKEQLRSETLYYVEGLKLTFASKTGVRWTNDCWLCANARGHCANCILKRCTLLRSAYTRACDKSLSLEARLKACDEIIQAIKDTDRYYVLENNKLTTVPGERKTKFEGTLNECFAFVDVLEEDEEE